jgi:4'-phosphopantetheinyl transferase
LNKSQNKIYLFTGSGQLLYKNWMDDNLDDNELNRLTSIQNVQDRNVFVACRYYLKKLASEFLGQHSDTLKIGYRPNGKPFIENEHINFNCSHTDDNFVIAITALGEIGIDIECINRSVVISKLSHLILSEREQTSLSQLREDKRKEMFLKIWTVKESFFKGLGGGLSLPLKHIEVKFKNDSVVGILNTFAGEFDLVNWQIIIPELNNDLIGAIAINCRSYDIELVNECLSAIISPELDL